MTRLLGISIGLLLLVASAAAQDFVFLSNRIRADPMVGESGHRLYQNELYRYLNGSEIRLTFTPGEEESDPSISPSGRFLAYLATDTVIDWLADVVPFDWTTQLRIMDLESGLLVEEWPMPGLDGQMRIAGGYDIVWQADEQSLLVQVFNDRDEASIARFDVGNPAPRILTRGAGIVLDATRGWIATVMDGYVTVFDPFSGNSYPLIMGQPLAWLDGQLLVGGPQLLLIDPVTADQTVIASDGDYISNFAASPDGSRYAWLGVHRDREVSVITIADEGFNIAAEWVHDGYLNDVGWLDSGSLVMTGFEGDRYAIREMSLEDGAMFVLVGTITDNVNPVVMPAMVDR